MNAQTILGIDPGKSGAIAVLDEAAIFCEFVGARPTDAKTAAFAFGRARGVIEGCAGALGLPIVFLDSAHVEALGRHSAWRRKKDLARKSAIARWPARADLFDRKRDVDLAKLAWSGLPV